MDDLLRFAEALTDGADSAVALFAVQRGNPAVTPQVFTGRASRFLVFADPQGTVRTAYRPGATDTIPLFVLDPNLRVLASLVLQDARATAHKVLALLDAFLPQIVPLEITTQAPVLLIPYALDQEICQSLIHVWETQGNVATGVEQSRGDRREATLQSRQQTPTRPHGAGCAARAPSCLHDRAPGDARGLQGLCLPGHTL